MNDQWVVNASPLIILAKIGRQHLLTLLPDKLVVPQAVVDEISVGPEDDPARQFLATSNLTIVEIESNPNIVNWDLGAGETAVLSYASANIGWRAVIDDNMARRCALTFSIPVIGTLGVIVRARRHGLIPAAVPIIKDIQAHGFRIDEKVIRVALRQLIDEEWL